MWSKHQIFYIFITLHASGKNGQMKDEYIVFKSIIENYRADDYMITENYIINFKK